MRERERQREKTVNNKQDKQQKDSGNNRKFKTAKSFFSKKKNKLISKKKNWETIIISTYYQDIIQIKGLGNLKLTSPRASTKTHHELASLPTAATPRASFVLLCSQHRPYGVLG